MTTQLRAVTGRRYPANYVADINARAPYALATAQAQRTDEYREDVLSLSEERLAFEKKMALEQMELEESQTKKANILGLGNLGANAYFGYQRSKALDAAIEAPGGAVVSGGAVPAGGIPDYRGIPATGGATPTGLSSLATAAPWKSAATDWKTMGVSGLAGLGFGQTVGEVIPFGGDAERAAMGGAVVGGLVSGFSSGWDPASMITGAIIGGVGGWAGNEWLF